MNKYNDYIFTNIKEINAELNNITEIKKLDYLLYSTWEILKETGLENIEKIHFELFMNNICSKIYFFYKDIKLSKIAYCLIYHLIDKKYMPLSYIKEFKEILKLNKKFENNLISNEIEECLEIYYIKEKIQSLFNNSNQTRRKISISIWDFKGNFIWLDDDSNKIFEYDLKNKNNNFKEEKNIFKLMIPDCLTYFYQTYGDVIFKNQENQKNNFIKFSYTIFSEKTVKKFIKIKKKLIKDNQKNSNFKPSENEKVFFKYLKSLSSRFKIILLSFKKSELIEMQKNKDNYFNFELLKNYLGKKEEVIIKAIYCETRKCKNILNFEYQNLKKNKNIKQFNKLINVSLSKAMLKNIN